MVTPPVKMPSPRAWQMAIATFFLIHALCSLVLLPKLPASANGEVFPVFTWWLFSKPPFHKTDYGVEVSVLGNEKWATPVDFEVIAARNLARESDDDFYRVIQEMGRAKHRQDEVGFVQARRVFETAYLSGAPAKYALIERKFDPVARYLGHGFQRREKIMEITTP